ncbi:BirA family biotin operon repressor/biotin-[acetyl-CoA-carboxylase] ligase [Desulfohalotomaculum tongense]|uniref:biotin--[acetyl-CoA-carboxylase] ligase n=1 Tax=Desulforadius tongensis TaxID=1216062 RepID=UPI001957AB88|nr:biotin--[acetyl-CoA-carboxylase] ligase [Desulforadius tongensis]MBM7856039.1 BirA family biotin operon repressor/biotin-[acetyl-CoA-carboxylase] ligase [Desulforadius tongensis]
MKKEVLNILKSNHSQWVSGEDMCRRLGISRTAVWKHIRNLKQDGYRIETQPRMGYRLVGVPDLLYPAEVVEGLNTKYFGQKIIHYQQVESTNEEAKKLAVRGVEQGTVVIAEQQAGGRGRLGRRWHSAFGKEIMFSVVLYPNINPAETPQVSMLAAVAVARAIEKTCAVRAGIKWPNDLLVSDKKVCGILVEIGAEVDRVKYVVLGIGINVNSTKQDWPVEIEHKATSLREERGTAVSRLKLMRSVLEELEQLYEVWQQQGFAPILRQWRAWCVSQHCRARVETIRGSYSGWIEGVNNNGELLLRLSDGSIHTFNSGDVSLRM